MREVWSLAMKDLRLLVRDRGGLFFTFFFPVLFAIFFGMIFGGGGGGGGTATPIIVVDEDGTEASEAFVALLEADEQLAVSRADQRDVAQDSVRKGEKVAFVIVPEGFAGASIFQGEPMRLLLGVDPSRQAEAGLIQGLLTAKAFERLQDMFLDPDSARALTADAIESVESSDMNPAQQFVTRAFLNSLDQFLVQGPEVGVFGGDAVGDDAGATGEGVEEGDGGGGFSPIEIESVELVSDEDESSPSSPSSTYAITFPQGIVWGVMGCAAGFGISLVSERNAGTLTRLRTAPLGRSRVLLGKGLACFLTTLGVAAMLLVIARLGFGVVPGSLPMLGLALSSIAVCFVGVMMLLATIGRTEASAGGIGWSVMIVFAMFGGGMIPLMFMDGWMVTLSHVSPVKWSILAMEGAIWRGFTVGDMLLPCGILVGVGVTGFLLGSRLFDWSES